MSVVEIHCPPPHRTLRPAGVRFPVRARPASCHEMAQPAVADAVETVIATGRSGDVDLDFGTGRL